MELIKLVMFVDTTYHIANWPVIHNEAAEACDNIVETHRLVPLPVYNSNGMLIHASCYKDAVAGALLWVNFTLTHWFIPASGTGEPVNTFVADLKSARILLDVPPRRSTKTKDHKSQTKDHVTL